MEEQNKAVTLPSARMAAHAAMEDLPPLIRVASVPENHVYVRHIGDVEGRDHVVRLPDPVPISGREDGVWWPPRMLGQAWVRGHADQFDVFHIHFGFDAEHPADLTGMVAALRELGKPLVYTVHDLRNPHHFDPRLHDAQLDVLIPAADELITLTAGAADEIERRWQRFAEVLPHPYVVCEPWRSRARPADHTFVVGVHAKSLRASMAPGPVITCLERVVAQLPGASLRVDIHNDASSPGSANYDPSLMSALRVSAQHGRLELHVHDCFSDDELWAYLSALDVSVLPYRFGTHSGWLEACHDLGTTVIAPDCGYITQQQACLSYRLTADRFDCESLSEAINTAYRSRPQWRADGENREAERARIAAAHRRIYERALNARLSRVGAPEAGAV